MVTTERSLTGDLFCFIGCQIQLTRVPSLASSYAARPSVTPAGSATTRSTRFWKSAPLWHQRAPLLHHSDETSLRHPRGSGGALIRLAYENYIGGDENYTFL